MSAFRNNDGFTLIEFAVSVVILSVGLLGLLQAVNLAISSNLTNTMRNEATVVADEQLSTRIAAISTSDAAPFTASPANLNVSRKIYNGFKNYSVARAETVTGNNSMEINVTVSWVHKNSRYTHNASSVVSKR
ncbi:MAG: prepilin-type N-terminal cleavage/methylation domain-containing protein [Desulfuromonadales bacterium]|nr:prepilin-type N-terminal cleavage/methylation domain-containing protein [Desulfuromonadales bacterium]